MDEGAYTLQIKCRLPVTDLFLRCPPSAPKESRRSPGAPPAGAHTAERLRASSAAGGYKLLDEGVYTLQIKCRLPVTDLFLGAAHPRHQKNRVALPGPHTRSAHRREVAGIIGRGRVQAFG